MNLGEKFGELKNQRATRTSGLRSRSDSPDICGSRSEVTGMVTRENSHGTANPVEFRSEHFARCMLVATFSPDETRAAMLLYRLLSSSNG